MTKTGGKVFLEYLKEVARDSGIPYTGFGNFSLIVSFQNDEILNLKITDYECNHKPK